MNYSDLTTALGDLMVATITDPSSASPSDDPNFNSILPRIITDAEQRIYRELDFLETRDVVYETSALVNRRIMSIPSTTIVLQGANIITDLSFISQTPSPGAVSNLFYFLSTGNSTIEINDLNNNTPFISAGQFINIVTMIGSEGNIPQSFIQGTYEIASVSINTPGSDLDYTIEIPSASTGNLTQSDTGFQFSTVSGSAQVSVFTREYHGLSIGSIITVGITTLMGVSTYIAAGDYAVTGITNAQIFTFNLPTAALDTATLVPENGNVISIQYLNNPITGKKNRIEIVSKDAMDVLWPTDLSEQGIPQYAAFIDSKTMALGPVPNQNYMVEFTGVFRPAPISSTNTSTYLSATYPDLFLAACMVFGMLYQKDADLPQGAPPGQDVTKWEKTYQERKTSVMEEVARQKGESTNWSSYQQTPLSTPPRP